MISYYLQVILYTYPKIIDESNQIFHSHCRILKEVRPCIYIYFRVRKLAPDVSMIFVIDRIVNLDNFEMNGITPETEVEELETILTVTKKQIKRRTEPISEFIWFTNSRLREQHIIPYEFLE